MTSEASSSALTSATFNDFNSRLQINALKTTKTGLALPNDVAFYRSMDSEFAKELDNFSSRVLSLANKVITFVATADTTSSRAKVKAKLENQDDINGESLESLLFGLFILQQDICLDEFSGRMKAPAITLNPVPQVTKVMKTVTLRGHLDPVIQHASHILKPQLSFRRKVENNDLPWYPSLSHKYNAQVPLGYEFHDSDADPASPIATHPYRYEIVHLRYPERIFEPVVPLPPKDFSDTPFTWVSTSDGLQAMLAKLRQASEIAVDLEHHDYRSYAGFVCLMQISTRDEDYIIDTLALREELVELNEIFTEQSIVKVFHGAESDIVWLQQDFNIYVVNLFDTFHASKSLDFPRHGLANLLEMYCDFIPDKRYQLADWRIRPLPKEMLEYARSDTHFLLYIYDNLRNALLDRAQSRAQSRAESRSPSGSPPRASTTEDTSRVLIKQVLAKSMETSLRTYEKEVYDAEGGTGSNGWDTLARKWNKGALLAGGPDVGVSALQRAVYQAVHKWREMVARMDDESTRYVLANHFLFQLAEQPPADMAALLGVFRSVPPVIRKYAKELLEVIRDCVKRHSLSGTTPSAPGVTLHPPVPQGTESSTVPQTKSNETPLPSLWTRTSESNAVTSTSSLFGATLTSICSTPRSLSVFSTTKSSLFGNAPSSISPSKLSENGHSYLPPHFRDVIARINSTLVSAPTMPRVAESNIETVPENGPEDAQVSLTEVSGMQVEVPFVPASQRRVVQVTEDDSIVVVGQARQRKRKRTKLTTDGLAEASSLKNEHKNKDGRAQDDVNNHEPFDFTAVPNILDDNPNVEDMKQKKQKRQKKQKTGGTFYGDFPAPPKAHSELKRGNQSYTFK
ncbi:Exosome complex exonuclease rrp6 [Termitomyces sp. J132]|nr:Exosome complex exonuclease rrp6 [Termitomyces sp. J132]